MLPAIISFAVCIGIPAAGAIYFLHRRDGTFLTFATGVLCFYISQPLIRIPLLGILGQKSDWFTLLPYTNIVLYFLFMGFTAGLFEETARYIGLKIFRKNRISWMDGLAFGLGHGGCEAVWLFISMVLPVIRQGQAAPGLILGAWERLFTMMLHIGLSFVVLYGIKIKQKRYLALAIALHTIVDFLIIIGNVWIIEGLITLEGFISIILVLKCKKNFDFKGGIQS